MVLALLSKAQIIDRTREAIEKKELPPLESSAVCYMMSKQAYLTNRDDHNMAHLLFYIPHGRCGLGCGSA